LVRRGRSEEEGSAEAFLTGASVDGAAALVAGRRRRKQNRPLAAGRRGATALCSGRCRSAGVAPRTNRRPGEVLSEIGSGGLRTQRAGR
jgi:hypothetical protein